MNHAINSDITILFLCQNKYTEKASIMGEVRSIKTANILDKLTPLYERHVYFRLRHKYFFSYKNSFVNFNAFSMRNDSFVSSKTRR